MPGVIHKIKLKYENEEERLIDVVYDNKDLIFKLFFSKNKLFKAGKDIVTIRDNFYNFEVLLNDKVAFTMNPGFVKINDVGLTKKLLE